MVRRCRNLVDGGKRSHGWCFAGVLTVDVMVDVEKRVCSRFILIRLWSRSLCVEHRPGVLKRWQTLVLLAFKELAF